MDKPQEILPILTELEGYATLDTTTHGAYVRALIYLTEYMEQMSHEFLAIFESELHQQSQWYQTHTTVTTQEIVRTYTERRLVFHDEKK